MSGEGITFAGKKTEDYIVGVLNESQGKSQRLTGKAKVGDIKWQASNSMTIVIESKKKAYNQTRAHKYLVVVNPIYDGDGWTGKWRVLSPVQVIKNLRNTQSKNGDIKRGQHTPCAMTCANLGSNSANDSLGGVVVGDRELPEAVISAFLEGEENTLMKQFAQEEAHRMEEYARETNRRWKEVMAINEQSSKKC